MEFKVIKHIAQYAATAVLQDLPEWTLYRAVEPETGNTSAVFGVVFSPKGDYLVSGANEGIIRLWGIP